MDEEMVGVIKNKIGFQKRVVYCRDCAHSHTDGEAIFCRLYPKLAIFPVYKISTCTEGFDKKRIERSDDISTSGEPNSGKEHAEPDDQAQAQTTLNLGGKDLAY